MEDHTRLEGGDLDVGMASAHPASRMHASPPDWQPPTSREEAEATIVSLSNDIGLILAQLSEDQAAWCQRTGRSPFDYAAWRRRALFAKVHKEHQLRECKRVRFQLMDHTVDGDVAAGGAVVLAHLVAECHRVLAVWRRSPRVDGPLDAALAHLAEQLAAGDGQHVPVELVGAVEPGELAG
jgi:hypothetical protein